MKDGTAVPALTTGWFTERPVAPALSESFSHVWTHRMPEVGAPPVIVTPDATIDVQWIEGKLRVAGPDKSPQTEVLKPGTTVIGFRFRPGAAAQWLGTAAHELRDQRVMLDDLWGAKARRLADHVGGDEDVTALIASLEGALAGAMPARIAADKVMIAAFTLIERGPPPGVSLIPWLGRALALSERTLRRRFDEAFGYGPKTLDRILRYQRFRKLSHKAPRTSTALLAAEAGYADQAHLVRESRRLTGRTPLALARMRRSG
ncbi:helix-turn-helix domain-containing protein [Taklimakanibacter lacteus]|uniref:helix-turn-helix domain-containing protein n=1 Tax=Taklimakanibacter lacteus TaxID=2268456 RepID=UPI000E673A11